MNLQFKEKNMRFLERNNLNAIFRDISENIDLFVEHDKLHTKNAEIFTIKINALEKTILACQEQLLNRINELHKVKQDKKLSHITKIKKWLQK